MNTIKFFKNWNNKLDCDYFTTIRLSTISKKEYYRSNIGTKFDVLLSGKPHCQAKLLLVDEYSLAHLMISKEQLLYLDAGLDKIKFYKLMNQFYKNKEEWKKVKTLFLVLLFKRIK